MPAQPSSSPPEPGRSGWALAVALIAVGVGGWFVLQPGAAPDPTPVRPAPIRQAEPTGAVVPLEAPTGLDPALVALGRRLFVDPQLSADGSLSCLSCHDLTAGGADHVALSRGIGGAEGVINAPTVFNRANDVALFWDGRARDLAHQAEFPLTDPREMGAEWDEVLRRLSADAIYVTAFDAALGRAPDEAGVRVALAEFQRGLVTLDSPFDRFLRGDADAITPAASRGWDRFQDHGSSSCHQGRNLGGNMFQVFGIYGDYFADRGGLTDADLGRFNATGDPRDKHVFKVPSLRNVAQTGPWLHDGSAARLEDVVDVMARYQLGRQLPPADVADIVAFLTSLTGTLPDGALR